jgi:EmrB/QacA subfamily drug resistance transporter
VRRLSDRTTAQIVVTLSAFLTPFMASSINVALPTISKEFSLDAVTLGWVPTSYMLASAMALLPAGRLADIHGRKRMFMTGTAVFGVVSLIIAVSPSAAFLIGARVVQGLGAAMMFTTGTAILISAFPQSERGRVLGINVAAVYFGGAIGPTLGGIMTEQFGWRSLFLAVAPLGLLVFALTLWKLNAEWADARGERFDLVGSIIYALALFLLITGLSSLPNRQGLVLLAAGALAIVLFILWEQRTGSPVLDLGLFRHNTVFAFSNVAAFINYCANAATSYLLSLYLQQIRGLSPESAGLILIAQPVVQALLSPLAGRLSDRIEPRILASAGMGCCALGLFLFASLSPTTPFVAIAGVLMILGAGFGLFSSPNTNAVMSSVAKKSYGVANATLSTMRVVGQTLSIGVVMLVFALFIGRVAIAPENYPALMTSTRVLFSMFAGLCVVGIFFSLARGKVR